MGRCAAKGFHLSRPKEALVSDRSTATPDPTDGPSPRARPSVQPPSPEEGAPPFPIRMLIQLKESVRSVPVAPLLV